MEMTYQLFANPNYMEHVEQIRAAKLKGENVWIPYTPKLEDYYHAGDFVFDISEGLGYLAYPESLMDCMFAIAISDYSTFDYKKVAWVPLSGNKKTALYPTDILVLDKMAMMYGTGTMEDSMGCPVPFTLMKDNVNILLDKLKIVQ